MTLNTKNTKNYIIYSNGSVYSKHFKRLINRRVAGSHGYIAILLDGEQHLMHRLIAQTFIPNPENKREVNHIDGNKLNNDVSNLEWVTSSENQKHAFRIGLKNNHHPRPSRRKRVVAIKDDKQVVYDSIRTASQSMGLLHTSIQNCLAGASKTAGGYSWHYL